MSGDALDSAWAPSIGFPEGEDGRNSSQRHSSAAPSSNTSATHSSCSCNHHRLFQSKSNTDCNSRAEEAADAAQEAFDPMSSRVYAGMPFLESLMYSAPPQTLLSAPTPIAACASPAGLTGALPPSLLFRKAAEKEQRNDVFGHRASKSDAQRKDSAAAAAALQHATPPLTAKASSVGSTPPNNCADLSAVLLSSSLRELVRGAALREDADAPFLNIPAELLRHAVPSVSHDVACRSNTTMKPPASSLSSAAPISTLKGAEATVAASPPTNRSCSRSCRNTSASTHTTSFASLPTSPQPESSHSAGRAAVASLSAARRPRTSSSSLTDLSSEIVANDAAVATLMIDPDAPQMCLPPPQRPSRATPSVVEQHASACAATSTKGPDAAPTVDMAVRTQEGEAAARDGRPRPSPQSPLALSGSSAPGCRFPDTHIHPQADTSLSSPTSTFNGSCAIPPVVSRVTRVPLVMSPVSLHAGSLTRSFSYPLATSRASSRSSNRSGGRERTRSPTAPVSARALPPQSLYGQVARGGEDGSCGGGSRQSAGTPSFIAPHSPLSPEAAWAPGRGFAPLAGTSPPQLTEFAPSLVHGQGPLERRPSTSGRLSQSQSQHQQQQQQQQQPLSPQRQRQHCSTDSAFFSHLERARPVASIASVLSSGNRTDAPIQFEDFLDGNTASSVDDDMAREDTAGTNTEVNDEDEDEDVFDDHESMGRMPRAGRPTRVRLNSSRGSRAAPRTGSRLIPVPYAPAPYRPSSTARESLRGVEDGDSFGAGNNDDVPSHGMRSVEMPSFAFEGSGDAGNGISAAAAAASLVAAWRARPFTSPRSSMASQPITVDSASTSTSSHAYPLLALTGATTPSASVIGGGTSTGLPPLVVHGGHARLAGATTAAAAQSAATISGRASSARGEREVVVTSLPRVSSSTAVATRASPTMPLTQRDEVLRQRMQTEQRLRSLYYSRLVLPAAGTEAGHTSERGDVLENSLSATEMPDLFAIVTPHSTTEATSSVMTATTTPDTVLSHAATGGAPGKEKETALPDFASFATPEQQSHHAETRQAALRWPPSSANKGISSHSRSEPSSAPAGDAVPTTTTTAVAVPVVCGRPAHTGPWAANPVTRPPPLKLTRRSGPASTIGSFSETALKASDESGSSSNPQTTTPTPSAAATSHPVGSHELSSAESTLTGGIPGGVGSTNKEATHSDDHALHDEAESAMQAQTSSPHTVSPALAEQLPAAATNSEAWPLGVVDSQDNARALSQRRSAAASASPSRLSSQLSAEGLPNGSTNVASPSSQHSATLASSPLGRQDTISSPDSVATTAPPNAASPSTSDPIIMALLEKSGMLSSGRSSVLLSRSTSAMAERPSCTCSTRPLHRSADGAAAASTDVTEGQQRERAPTDMEQGSCSAQHRRSTINAEVVSQVCIGAAIGASISEESDSSDSVTASTAVAVEKPVRQPSRWHVRLLWILLPYGVFVVVLALATFITTHVVAQGIVSHSWNELHTYMRSELVAFMEEVTLLPVMSGEILTLRRGKDAAHPTPHDSPRPPILNVSRALCAAIRFTDLQKSMVTLSYAALTSTEARDDLVFIPDLVRNKTNYTLGQRPLVRGRQRDSAPQVSMPFCQWRLSAASEPEGTGCPAEGSQAAHSSNSSSSISSFETNESAVIASSFSARRQGNAKTSDPEVQTAFAFCDAGHSSTYYATGARETVRASARHKAANVTVIYAVNSTTLDVAHPLRPLSRVPACFDGNTAARMAHVLPIVHAWKAAVARGDGSQARVSRWWISSEPFERPSVMYVHPFYEFGRSEPSYVSCRMDAEALLRGYVEHQLQRSHAVAGAKVMVIVPQRRKRARYVFAVERNAVEGPFEDPDASHLSMEILARSWALDLGQESRRAAATVKTLLARPPSSPNANPTATNVAYTCPAPSRPHVEDECGMNGTDSCRIGAASKMYWHMNFAAGQGEDETAQTPQHTGWMPWYFYDEPPAAIHLEHVGDALMQAALRVVDVPSYATEMYKRLNSWFVAGSANDAPVRNTRQLVSLRKAMAQCFQRPDATTAADTVHCPERAPKLGDGRRTFMHTLFREFDFEGQRAAVSVSAVQLRSNFSAVVVLVTPQAPTNAYRWEKALRYIAASAVAVVAVGSTSLVYLILTRYLQLPLLSIQGQLERVVVLRSAKTAAMASFASGAQRKASTPRKCASQGARDGTDDTNANAVAVVAAGAAATDAAEDARVDRSSATCHTAEALQGGQQTHAEERQSATRTTSEGEATQSGRQSVDEHGLKVGNLSIRSQPSEITAAAAVAAGQTSAASDALSPSTTSPALFPRLRRSLLRRARRVVFYLMQLRLSEVAELQDVCRELRQHVRELQRYVPARCEFDTNEREASAPAVLPSSLPAAASSLPASPEVNVLDSVTPLSSLAQSLAPPLFTEAQRTAPPGDAPRERLLATPATHQLNAQQTTAQAGRVAFANTKHSDSNSGGGGGGGAGSSASHARLSANVHSVECSRSGLWGLSRSLSALHHPGSFSAGTAPGMESAAGAALLSVQIESHALHPTVGTVAPQDALKAPEREQQRARSAPSTTLLSFSSPQPLSEAEWTLNSDVNTRTADGLRATAVPDGHNVSASTAGEGSASQPKGKETSMPKTHTSEVSHGHDETSAVPLRHITFSQRNEDTAVNTARDGSAQRSWLNLPRVLPTSTPPSAKVSATAAASASSRVTADATLLRGGPPENSPVAELPSNDDAAIAISEGLSRGVIPSGCDGQRAARSCFSKCFCTILCIHVHLGDSLAVLPYFPVILETVEECVHRYGGTIDIFLPEMIYISFGSRGRMKDHALLATRCGIEVFSRLSTSALRYATFIVDTGVYGVGVCGVPEHRNTVLWGRPIGELLFEQQFQSGFRFFVTDAAVPLLRQHFRLLPIDVVMMDEEAGKPNLVLYILLVGSVQEPWWDSFNQVAHEGFLDLVRGNFEAACPLYEQLLHTPSLTFTILFQYLLAHERVLRENKAGLSPTELARQLDELTVTCANELCREHNPVVMPFGAAMPWAAQPPELLGRFSDEDHDYSEADREKGISSSGMEAAVLSSLSTPMRTSATTEEPPQQLTTPPPPQQAFSVDTDAQWRQRAGPASASGDVIRATAPALAPASSVSVVSASTRGPSTVASLSERTQATQKTSSTVSTATLVGSLVTEGASILAATTVAGITSPVSAAASVVADSVRGLAMVFADPARVVSEEAEVLQRAGRGPCEPDGSSSSRESSTSRGAETPTNQSRAGFVKVAETAIDTDSDDAAGEEDEEGDEDGNDVAITAAKTHFNGIALRITDLSGRTWQLANAPIGGGAASSRLDTALSFSGIASNGAMAEIWVYQINAVQQSLPAWRASSPTATTSTSSAKPEPAVTVALSERREMERARPEAAAAAARNSASTTASGTSSTSVGDDVASAKKVVEKTWFPSVLGPLARRAVCAIAAAASHVRANRRNRPSLQDRDDQKNETTAPATSTIATTAPRKAESVKAFPGSHHSPADSLSVSAAAGDDALPLATHAVNVNVEAMHSVAQRYCHGNMVQLISIAVTHAHVYAITEWVAGRTLRETVNRFGSRLALASTRKCCVSVLRALDYLHNTRGVVHGRVHPDNILFGVEGNCKITGMLYLYDWALPDPALHARLTRAPAAYGSPEMNESGAAPTPASDIYTFGLLLLQMLTGETPWTWAGSPALSDTSKRELHALVQDDGVFMEAVKAGVLELRQYGSARNQYIRSVENLRRQRHPHLLEEESDTDEAEDEEDEEKERQSNRRGRSRRSIVSRGRTPQRDTSTPTLCEDEETAREEQEIDPAMLRVLESCLAYEPAERKGASELLEMLSKM